MPRGKPVVWNRLISIQCEGVSSSQLVAGEEVDPLDSHIEHVAEHLKVPYWKSSKIGSHEVTLSDSRSAKVVPHGNMWCSDHLRKVISALASVLRKKLN